MTKKSGFSGQSLRKWLAWIVYISIGFSLVFSAFYIAISYLGFATIHSTLFSSSQDLIVWGSALIIIFAWFFIDVFKGVLDQSYGIFTSLTLTLILVALFATACFVLAGILSTVLLSIVSISMVALSFVFCQNVLSVSRIGLAWRLILTAIIASAIVEVILVLL